MGTHPGSPFTVRPKHRSPGSDVLLDLAGPGDEPDLRRLLRENPLEGEIRLSLEREPEFFRAAALEGPRHLTFLGRDPTDGRPVGMGTRSSRPCFVNGTRVILPYLGALRIDRSWRHLKRYLAAAYDLCGAMGADDEAPYCLTSIVADNAVARRFLGASRPGFPPYTEVEAFWTFVLPSDRRGGHPTGLSVRKGRPEDLTRVADLLRHHGERHQFHPVWSPDELCSEERTPGLTPGDFLLVERGGNLMGCLAVWDQRPFKQSVVRGYSRRLHLLRPALNLAAPLLGVPRLPSVGAPLAAIFGSHLALAEEDPAVVLSLLCEARRETARRGATCLLFGLAERHPLRSEVARTFRHRAYRSILYLVHWPERGGALPDLDGRVPHVEVAVL